MYTAVQSRFAEAVKNGSLIYTQTKQIPTKFNGVDVIYTLAPALDKKPTKDDVDAKNDGTPNSTSPWLPPEDDLVIEKQENYTVVLNKFALAKYHFLLVTNDFERQSAPLSPRDLKAAFDVLRRANKESGKRHIGFYNSGSNSGASIPHRHIQFMTLPDSFTPFPDQTPPSPKENAPASDPRVPFSHFITHMKSTDDEEDLAQSYMVTLSRVITMCGRHGSPLSYNLVFTEEWIMATPRSQEKTNGISINSLGTIGLILTKNDDQLSYVQEKGLEIIKDLGFENDPEPEGAAETNDGYIKY